MLNLIVGCGGAGLATLEALCERLAFSRKRNLRKYAFLAIDSDRAALANFEHCCSRLFGNNHPAIRLVQLGRGYCMCDIVEPHFITPYLNGNNPEGRERLQQHWWHDANGQPYEAVGPKPHSLIPITPLTAMA